MNEPVIVTNTALCHDCYRCVRSCDVKAIRVKEGQAQIVPELCIICGTCVRVCPQQAKGVQSARTSVRRAMAAGKKVIASVAPSAPACFPIESFSQIESALKSLGFFAAEETAVAAEIVGLAHRNYLERMPERTPLISSSCPVIVNLIEQYYPDLIPNLAPLVSPMIAHGRMLAQKYGPDSFIVFIGPCIAKKKEILEESLVGSVHAAMTFAGLNVWLTEEGIDFSPSPPKPPPAKQTVTEDGYRGIARLFPLEGGLIGTARMKTDILAEEVILASGIEDCQATLKEIRTSTLSSGLVELMACKGGCLKGPRMPDKVAGVTLARQKILRFQRTSPGVLTTQKDCWPPLERPLKNRQMRLPEFSEEQIREIMHCINKYSVDDELNCGACGYSTCREKAVATLRGMAEITMCIPYMRRRSESLRQVVMDVVPDPILIVNDNLTIQDISPAMEQLFACRHKNVVGEHLSTIFPLLEDFITVRNTGQPVIGKVCRLKEGIIVELTVVRVEKQALLLAILRDITEREKERAKFNALREETLDKTREVVSKQMRVAHEIAKLLGETTAESKMIVSRLARLLEGEGNP